MPTHPTAFISYSWDDEAHKEWVKQLATQLRHDGVDARLDHWHAVPGDQLPEFMEREIRQNDYVLIICTPKYKEKSDKRAGGVGYEGDIMTAEVLTKQNHRKFIPVLAKGSWAEAAPSWLLGTYHLDLSDVYRYPGGYQDLLTTILSTRPKPPPLGPPPPGYTPPAHSEPAGQISLEPQQASEGFETIFSKGEQRYSAAMAGRAVYHHFEGFLNIALVIHGLTKAWEPTFDFLRILRIANPELTGWPIWLISDSFPNQDMQPYFWYDTYEQYIYRKADGRIPQGHLDFAIFDPKGRFFLRRAFEDDMGADALKGSKTIEIYIQAWRIAEALAVGKAFANALGASSETTLNFAFRWSGIKNRQIDLWAHPGAEFVSARASQQDISQCEVNIAASANDEEIVARTVDALQKLVLPFGDVKIPRQFLSEKLRTDLFKH